MIGKADLYDGQNASLSQDKFGRSASALSLVNGYYKVPAGIYFGGSQFSILVWVKVRNFNVWSRIIDFSTGGLDNQLIFGLSYDFYGNPFFAFRTVSTVSLHTKASIVYNSNEWHHLSIVFQSPTNLFYLDGVQVSFVVLDPYVSDPINAIRDKNFIGRSNFQSTDQDANADFDELKIFNRALSQQEIQYEINNNIFV